MRLLYLFIGLLCMFSVIGQSPTVGVLSKVTNRQEYNLFFPFTQNTVYLVDNCGQLINKWQDDVGITPGPACYLTPKGELLVTKAKGSSLQDTIRAGGAGEFIELRSWNNDLLWQFKLNNGKARLHHDVKYMPNGNILAIAWENFSPEESIKNGRRHDLITEGAVWPDYIIELDPKKNAIIWEWHAWDHLIQDHDSTKLNYGKVSDRPERIDINHIYSSGQADWMHINGIDYNEELDVIALSVSHFDEVWLIDHSVTPQQAKGRTGGRYGKGGDILYRWGNPLAYKQGKLEDQKLFFQHDVRFINEGKYKGCISVFNNRFNTAYSSCSIFKPVLNAQKNEFLKQNSRFLPMTYEANFIHPVNPNKLRSTGLSNFQLTPNGNIFAFAGGIGYAVEFDESGKIFWEYVVPFSGGRLLKQFEVPNSNFSFKMEKYQANFEGFKGKDLSQKGYLELDPIVSNCISVNVNDINLSSKKLLKQTISNDGSLHLVKDENDLKIIDLFGRLIRGWARNGLMIELENSVPNGIYFILNDQGKSERFTLVR
jgi:hypothetical protein